MLPQFLFDSMIAATTTQASISWTQAFHDQALRCDPFYASSYYQHTAQLMFRRSSQQWFCITFKSWSSRTELRPPAKSTTRKFQNLKILCLTSTNLKVRGIKFSWKSHSQMPKVNVIAAFITWTLTLSLFAAWTALLRRQPAYGIGCRSDEIDLFLLLGS